MVVYKRHSSPNRETLRLLGEVHEEIKQLRAATQVYIALLQRLLPPDPENTAPRRPHARPPDPD